MSIKVQRLLEGLKHFIEQNNQNSQFQYVIGSKTYYCQLEIWKKDIFVKLYDINLKQIEIDFHKNIQLPDQILGKRSSDIILSQSRKYCLKIVSKDDINTFQSMLQDYIKLKQQSQDYLIDIYRTFILHYVDTEGHKFDDIFILMPNIRADFENILSVYDIKGHTESRKLDTQDFEDFKYGKDQNFIVSKQLTLIKNELKKQEKDKFINKLIEHSILLSKYNIIDYSLLLVIYKGDINQQQKAEKNKLQITNNIWMKWAIIDYFQAYNKLKQMQNKFKSMFLKEYSSVDPQHYSKRLIQFLRKNIY